MTWKDRLRGFVASPVLTSEVRLNARIDRLEKRIGELRVLTGSQIAREVTATAKQLRPREAEFKVFSQFNEDGIIQWLIARLGLSDGRFIEFGVENFAEANTRFLLEHNNWKGLILDSSDEHLEFIRGADLLWRHDIAAVSAFVGRDNINELFTEHGFTGEIELLSIDIDSTDYWVWEALEVTNPKIVIMEYNSIFGPDLAVTVPYRPDFDYGAAHYSKLYFGASLAATNEVANRKGYRLVAVESHGTNAFFVRDDCMGNFDELAPRDAWVESRFSSARARDGSLTFLKGHTAQLQLIRDMPLIEVPSGRQATIAELYGV